MKNVLLDVSATDPELPWMGGWGEAQFVRMWYPITVATQDYFIKRDIYRYLLETSDDPMAEIDYKLHCFGSRGVSSRESAGIGGMARLVNFKGSDTCVGVVYANHYYNHPMAANSIPASEHSVICLWGRENERKFYRHMKNLFAKPGKTWACVSDTTNLWDVMENVWGDELKDEIAASGSRVVPRPDSGKPSEVDLKSLQILDRKIGMTPNKKGYKVLPDWIRLIQGDGVNRISIPEILEVLKQNKFSASNIGFGMGGAGLQMLDRDTQSFKFACTAGVVDGKEVRVQKDPITDPNKQSRAGRLSLVMRDGKFETIEGDTDDNHLVPIWDTGKNLATYTLEEIRQTTGKEFV